ncbi:MAG: anhydro-N-acetylmuramic acid kinase, partial [Acidobacteria bacterium]
ALFLGRKIAVTWQTGEGAVVAARTGLPVVSDFRTADMAAGGKGAPLVPYLDHLLYCDPKIGRIALNLGGIANLSAVPRAAALDRIVAFDTGPGNMVIDALVEQLFGQPCDRDGRIAASGRVLEGPLERFLNQGFFREKPPKTAGREQFGREFAREFLHVCRPSGRPKRGNFSELIVSGGGAKNPTLMAWLGRQVGGMGLRVRSSDEFGIPSSAKEAVAFAVMAYESWNHRPSNVPSATGAKRAVVLGKICYP